MGHAKRSCVSVSNTRNNCLIGSSPRASVYKTIDQSRSTIESIRYYVWLLSWLASYGRRAVDSKSALRMSCARTRMPCLAM